MAVQVEKSAEVIFLYLGVVRAGAVFLPLNTAYTPAEIGYFLGDAEPALFVCDPGKREALSEAAAGVRQVWTLDAAGQGSAAEAADAQDGPPSQTWPVARRISRRSSTHPARPALQGRHAEPRQPRVQCPRAGAALALHGRDVLIHALPVFHTHGLFVATNTVLASGGSMLFLPGSTRRRFSN